MASAEFVASPVSARLRYPIALVRIPRALEPAAAFADAENPQLPWIWPLLVFVLAAGLTFTAIYMSTLRSASGLAIPRFVQTVLPDTSLGLRVEFQGEDLLVAWNRQSRAVRNAVTGVLRIEDGGDQRDVHLDAAQIAAASILYRPASDDITFRLELFDDQGGSAVESLRVLSPRDSPLANTPAANNSDPAASARWQPSSSAAPHEPVVRHRLRREAETRAGAETSDPAAADTPSEAPAHTPDYVPPVSTPPSAALSKTETATPPDSMPDGKTLLLFKPAHPVRQVMPDADLLRAAPLDKTTQVEVRVTIDSTGHVIDARLASSPSLIASGLPEAALAAARQWLFEPATMRGKPVETEDSIRFNFQPPSR